nr:MULTISPECIES: ATP-grasp fold amidoligase family protein [unclassified Ectothiorhodospira]
MTGVSPRLFKPSTFNEHVQRGKLLQRQKIYTIYADKLAVREYVARVLGYDAFPKIIWSGRHLEDLQGEKLPSEYVLKTNHSWRTQMIVRSGEKIDFDEAAQTFEKWLANDHSIKTGEYQYRWIEPQVFAEEIILRPDRSLPDEFNFFCFHGRVQMIEFHRGRFSKHIRAYLTRDFKRLPIIRSGYERLEESLEAPLELAEMIKIAERISANDKFLRVDFMYGERPFLAELTLRPGSGTVSFDPPSADFELGKLWSDSRMDLAESGKAKRVR